MNGTLHLQTHPAPANGPASRIRMLLTSEEGTTLTDAEIFERIHEIHPETDERTTIPMIKFCRNNLRKSGWAIPGSRQAETLKAKSLRVNDHPKLRPRQKAVPHSAPPPPNRNHVAAEALFRKPTVAIEPGPVLTAAKTPTALLEPANDAPEALQPGTTPAARFVWLGVIHQPDDTPLIHVCSTRDLALRAVANYARLWFSTVQRLGETVPITDRIIIKEYFNRQDAEKHEITKAFIDGQ